MVEERLTAPWSFAWWDDAVRFALCESHVSGTRHAVRRDACSGLWLVDQARARLEVVR